MEFSLSQEFRTAGVIGSGVFEPTEADLRSCYGVKVRAASEHAISQTLRQKGFRVEAPMHTVSLRYSDRIKKAERALFPGYVFVWMQVRDWFRVVATNGVSYVVRSCGTLLPLTEEETKVIEVLCRTKIGCEPYRMLNVGQRVLIEEGMFAGLTGVLHKIQDDANVVVAIESLRQAVRVSIGTNRIRLLDRSIA